MKDDLNPYKGTLPDGRGVCISRMTYGKCRINVSPPGDNVSITIGW